MTKSPMDKFLDRIAGPRRSGREYSGYCPAHPDRHRSLSIGRDEQGNVLLFCHAGCNIKAVLSALGLHYRDMFNSGKEKKYQ